MKYLLFILTIILFQKALLAEESYSISKYVYHNEKLKRPIHIGKGRFSSYLVMNINYPPVESILSQINKKQGVNLKTRGEAHITVVTPLEFFDVLKDKISMKEINTIAKNSLIQKSKFEIICLGKGSHLLDKKIESTYYIVIKSESLYKIRQKVYNLFVKRGGESTKFKVKKYYPHITIGFTKRDLHESDGIIKTDLSCINDILIN